MYTSEFTNLKMEYEHHRGLHLNHEQFAALLYTMPSILIAESDGKIDAAERELIRGIPGSLLEGYRNDHHIELKDADELSEDYYSEIKYLINHQEEWRQKFIHTLREELQQKVNDKNAIYDTMWKAAFSSSNVNEHEVEKIKALTKELGF